MFLHRNEHCHVKKIQTQQTCMKYRSFKEITYHLLEKEFQRYDINNSEKNDRFKPNKIKTKQTCMEYRCFKEPTHRLLEKEFQRYEINKSENNDGYKPIHKTRGPR